MIKKYDRLYGAIVFAVKLLLFILIYSLYAHFLINPLHFKNYANIRLADNLKFSDDGSIITASTYRDVFFWRVDDGKLLYGLPCDNSPYVFSAISPDNNYIASGSPSRINVLNIMNNRIVRKISGKRLPGYSFDFGPDSNFLVASDGNVFSLSDGKEFRFINNDNGNSRYFTLGMKAEGCFIAEISFIGENSNESVRINLIDFDSGKVVKEYVFTNDDNYSFFYSLYSRSHSEIYRKVYTGGTRIFFVGKRTLRIIDMSNLEDRTLRFATEFKMDHSMDDIVYGVSNDGTLLSTNNTLVTGSGGGFDLDPHKIRTYDVKSSKLVSTIPFSTEKPLRNVAVNSKKRLLACGYHMLSVNGSVYLYDFDRGIELKELMMMEPISIGKEKK